MTRRTNTHRVADKAVAKIQDIIAISGFSSEAIHHDYGEDLLVQTSLNDEVDPNKIWIQAKGTENIAKYERKAGCYRLTISVNHAYRWVRASGLVVVVLWDTVNGVGYWSLPKGALHELEFRTSGKSTVQIDFSKEKVFNAEAMKYLSWVARFDHYRSLLSVAMARDEEAICFKYEHQSLVPLIAMDFLKMLKVMTGDGLDPVFFAPIRDRENRLNDWDEEESGDKLMAIIILSLLARVGDVANIALPSFLINVSATFLEKLINNVIHPTTGKFIA